MNTTLGNTGLIVNSGCWATAQVAANAAGCSTSAWISRKTTARASGPVRTPRALDPAVS